MESYIVEDFEITEEKIEELHGDDTWIVINLNQGSQFFFDKKIFIDDTDAKKLIKELSETLEKRGEGSLCGAVKQFFTAKDQDEKHHAMVRMEEELGKL